jgi:tetratricopeptide (TPR) repeat protein
VRALQLASAFVKQHPTHVGGLVLAARAHLARDEYVPAYELLRKALAADPKNPEVLYFLGLVAGSLAARAFDRVYALAPDSARVHQLMARSLKLQEKLAEAAAEYELALRANPDLLEALVELAAVRREESKCDEAVALYERAERVKPTYEAAYGLGACLAAQGQHKRAIEAFQQALDRDPRSAIAHFGMGNSLLQSGDAAAAVRALDRAVALQPKMRQAHYLLGRAYNTLGLRDRSEQAFARADELAKAERLPPKPAR